jgi:hypothetical protein
MLHHPYNWIEAENYRAVKSFIEANCDIVLTGHEHVAAASRRLAATEEQLDYVEAPALYDPETGESGFQLLALDFERDQQSITRFEWRQSRYCEFSTREWTLARNLRRPTTPFKNSEAFSRVLRSVGTGFRHPRCSGPNSTLVLRDLYVYPDLRHRDVEGILTGKTPKSATVVGDQIADFVQARQNVVIYGADDSGKSSLAKVLYEDFRERGLLPLLIGGEQFKQRTDPAGLMAALKTCIEAQYSSEAVEPYLQTSSTMRILIIDDFHKARLTKLNQKALLDQAKTLYTFILVFASDLFAIQETATPTAERPFRSFERCDIKELGRFHRHRLIERWHYLGREDSAEPDELNRLVLLTDKTIATVLGKNVLPHYPVTILTLLQLLEAKETPNTANGSYGFLYEVLIKTALATVGDGTRGVDMKVTYLSGIAFSMFKKKYQIMTETEMRTEHTRYCQRFDMILDFPTMMLDLRSAEILIIDSNGNYRFKYPYIFYYAVAKYLQENTAVASAELDEIADHIYNDANANTLIFYVYLTKDARLIGRLIENASAIYDEHAPCDMEGHVTFINAMFKQVSPPLQLDSSDVRANRDLHNRKQDNAASEHDESSPNIDDFKYDRELHDIIKINIAFKTVQILGQVLRNFPGSLEGPLKLKITSECYALGMRTLRAILGIAENNLGDMRQYLGSLIAERTGLSDAALATQTDRAIVWLAVVAAWGSVKRIAYAVGHPDLTPTYKKVLEANDNIATDIIDVAIKLDQYDTVPEIDLRRLKRKIQKNPFAYTIARDLVADRLYLYKHDYPTMQMLAAMWNIEITSPRYLVSRDKKG